MQPQRFGLFLRELEHKVRRKTVGVSANRKVEVFREHLVDPGQMAVEHDLLAVDHVDPALNKWHRSRDLRGAGVLGHLRVW